MRHTLVTGASAGLGAEFARACASCGQPLILTARRADRLETLAAGLRAAHGVAVTAIAADLADPAGPARLVAAIERDGLAVGTLINNAGLGHRGAVATLGEGEQLAIVDVNIRALVALTRRLLPAMIERGDGGILNVASSAAFQPGPWMAVYYASKAFVLSFSEALHVEVAGTGVRVAALCPGPVHTEFASLAGMDDMGAFAAMATPAARVVADGLAALDANRAVAVSGWINKVGATVMPRLPRALARRMIGTFQKAR